MGEEKKEEEHRRDIEGGAYDWEVVMMESEGRPGTGANNPCKPVGNLQMHVTNRLARIAADADGVEKHVFVRGTQEALSMARERGIGYVWNKGLQAMAYGGGWCFQEA